MKKFIFMTLATFILGAFVSVSADSSNCMGRSFDRSRECLNYFHNGFEHRFMPDLYVSNINFFRGEVIAKVCNRGNNFAKKKVLVNFAVESKKQYYNENVYTKLDSFKRNSCVNVKWAKKDRLMSDMYLVTVTANSDDKLNEMRFDNNVSKKWLFIPSYSRRFREYPVTYEERNPNSANYRHLIDESKIAPHNIYIYTPPIAKSTTILSDNYYPKTGKTKTTKFSNNFFQSPRHGENWYNVFNDNSLSRFFYNKYHYNYN